MAGTLILCAGPIGNLGDAPPRLAEALDSASIVYAEDTRRARILLDRLGVDRPTRSYFVGNESDRAKEITERLAAGETLALLTDAGTPGIADPGLTAVRAAVQVNASITGIPGPSAVTLALAVSGLSADRFVFEGFLPRKGRRRSERIQGLRREERTVVLFSAPGRLATDLGDLCASLDAGRTTVVCRELTKLHEEIWRGTLDEAVAEWSARAVRGEVTLVIDGAGPTAPDEDDAVAMARRFMDEGMSASSASRMAAEESGVARRRIYNELNRRDEGTNEQR